MEKIIRLQLALFFAEHEPRPDRLMAELNNSMGNLFDGMPQIIPMPAGSPPELPSVVLTSENKKYSCNIANSRVDLIYTGGPDWEMEWKNILQDFQAKKNLFCNYAFNNKNILRFGFVAQFFIHEKSPSFQIGRKYLKADLGNLAELNIRYNKIKELHGFSLNDVYSITAAKEFIDGNFSDGIFIERDINNISNGNFIKIEDTKLATDKLAESFYPDKIKALIK